MNCKIINNHGHFEVYINGTFYCSADTMAEVIHEIRNECSSQEEDYYE